MATKTEFDHGPDAIHSPSPSNSETSSALDDTYEAYKKHEGIELDPTEAKKVRRKIDIRIVPILFFVYLLQYLDKNGINYASAYGLQKGTGLVGQDYSWLSTYSERWSKELDRDEADNCDRFHLLLWIPCWTVPCGISSAATSCR